LVEQHLLDLGLAPAHTVAEADRLHDAPAEAAELAPHRDGLAGGRVCDDEVVAAVRPRDGDAGRGDVLHHEVRCRSAIVDDVVAPGLGLDVGFRPALAGEILVADSGYKRVVAVRIPPFPARRSSDLLVEQHLLDLGLGPTHAIAEADRLHHAPAEAA